MATPRVSLNASNATRAKKVQIGSSMLPVPADASVAQLTGAVRKHLSAWGKADAHSRADLGGLLSRIRGKLQHGDWAEWVESHVPFSQRTAQQLIELSEWSKRNALLFHKLAPLGASKLYVLVRLQASVLEALLVRPTHVVPSTGARKSLDVMTRDELAEVLAAQRGTPDVDMSRVILERSQARVRSVVRSIGLVIEHEADMPRDAIEDMHDELVAAAAELAKAFDLDD